MPTFEMKLQTRKEPATILCSNPKAALSPGDIIRYEELAILQGSRATVVILSVEGEGLEGYVVLKGSKDEALRLIEEAKNGSRYEWLSFDKMKWHSFRGVVL